MRSVSLKPSVRNVPFLPRLRSPKLTSCWSRQAFQFCTQQCRGTFFGRKQAIKKIHGVQGAPLCFGEDPGRPLRARACSFCDAGKTTAAAGAGEGLQVHHCLPTEGMREGREAKEEEHAVYQMSLESYEQFCVIVAGML